MIHYFIAAIQYSLTAFMLISLCYGAAACLGIPGARKRLDTGAAAGALFALTLAVLRRTTAINRGMVNTPVLMVSIIAALCLIPLVWGVGASRFPRAHAALFRWSGALFAGTLAASSMPSLFLLPSEFILAGQSVFSTEFLLKSTGALGGASLALLLGLALFRSVRNRRKAVLRTAFTLMAAANLASQAAAVFQFLMARRVIPLIRGLFRLVMAAVNHEAVFRYACIIAALILPGALLAGALSRSAPQGGNPAETRKMRAALLRDRRRGALAIGGLALALASLTALNAWDRREVTLSPAEPMTVAGEEIIIPLERVEDGRLHRFAWNAQGGVEVRFIVIKKNAAAYGVGLDACDICGSTGYYERRDEVICRLCDVVMNKSTIGFKGGCNPVPLAYTVRQGAMIVQIGDLEREKSRFH
ncbi:MAG: Fe-S-containing protein [Spirochaetaceae bacterium]|jgi:uncharacterized membrane protein|nr:Fe-S-containing protein [Spirochaetaceae bacterium]